MLKPILNYAMAWFDDDLMDRTLVGAVFLLLYLCSCFTESLGIHAFIGAFAFGAIVPRRCNFVHELAQRIELVRGQYAFYRTVGAH